MGQIVLVGKAFSFNGRTDVLMFCIGEEDDRVNGRVQGVVNGCYGLLIGKIFGIANATQDELYT